MTALRTVALASIALFGIALAVPVGFGLALAVPAGSSQSAGNCGPVVDIRDPGLKASFARFDANQSASAAKICAIYLDTSR